MLFVTPNHQCQSTEGRDSSRDTNRNQNVCGYFAGQLEYADLRHCLPTYLCKCISRTTGYWQWHCLADIKGMSPSAPVDLIWTMNVVWRLRGKSIRTVLCTTVVHSDTHTHEQCLEMTVGATNTVLVVSFVSCKNRNPVARDSVSDIPRSAAHWRHRSQPVCRSDSNGIRVDWQLNEILFCFKMCWSKQHYLTAVYRD